MQFGYTSRHLLAVNIKGGTTPNFCTIVVILLAAVISHVGGKNGEFQVKIHGITNPHGMTADGGCCGGSVSIGGSCPSPCRTFFTICLSQLSSQSDCAFGRTQTKPFPQSSFVLPGNSSLHPLPFTFSWPQSFTLEVTAKDDLGSNLSKVIENVVVKRSLLPGPQWQNVTQGKIANVTFSYRVLCDKNYYGNSCSKYCSPRNDVAGHWTCDEMGNRVCRPGWTGDFCNEAHCPNPCSNGNCVGPGKCECYGGWKGDLCDECVKYPGCAHGTCTKPYECKCHEGWTGLHCDLRQDQCGTKKPCVSANKRMCQNIGPGRYECICKPGYDGRNCEKEKNECQPNPCKNGGKCEDLFADFNCSCPQGFKGKRCERPECTPSTCKNGGTCVEGSANVSCVCPPGFSGRICHMSLSTTPTTSILPGRADNSSATQDPGGSGKRVHVAVIVVAPLLGTIFIVFVVLMICCRKRMKIFRLCCKSTEQSASHMDKETRNYENKDPEMLKECEGDKQCRVTRPARTPEIIINFEPTRQSGKNVNHYQNSQKDDKEWKDSKLEEEETEERTDEKERRRKELQERRRTREKEEEEARGPGSEGEKQDVTGTTLMLKEIRNSTNPSAMTLSSYEKGFWQEVELEI